MKRIKRWKKVLIILLVVVVGLPLVAWVVVDRMASAAVRSEVRALEAKGQSLSWEVLAPTRPPDVEDAGPVYQQAFPLLSETGSETEDVLLRYYADPPWDAKTRQRLIDAAGESVKATAVTEEMYWEMARQRLARNKQGLDLVERAAAMNQCWFRVNYEAGVDAPMPHLGRLRASARLLSLRARVERRDGDLAGTYKDIETALRLERGLRQPVLVSNLVGALIVRLALKDLKDTLPEDDADPPAWRRLLEELNGLDLKAAFVGAMQGERVSALETLDAGPSKLAGLGGTGKAPTVGQRLLWSVGRPLLKYNKAHFLHHMTAIVAAVQQEPPQAFRAIEAAEASLSERPQWWSALAGLHSPAMGRAYELHVESQAERDLARVALALKLHKHAHAEYPETLDALAPDRLKQVPYDLFTGKPLFYRRTEKGFLLYSVGRDREDNNGNDTPPDERRRDEGVDIVWKAEM